MSKNYPHVQIPNELVRNDSLDFDASDFCLYAILKFIDFTKNSGGRVCHTLEVNHQELMFKIGISDTRNLKRTLNKLNQYKIIKNKINKLPTKGALAIEFDDSHIKTKGFVKLPIRVFDKIHLLGQEGIRLLGYYESYINRMGDISRRYCFASRDTIAKSLRISKTTLDKYNEILVEHKLLKIKKHSLQCTNEYNEKDSLIFTKFNNHYYVNFDVLDT